MIKCTPKPSLLVVFVLVTGLIFSACGGSGSSESESQTPSSSLPQEGSTKQSRKPPSTQPQEAFKGPSEITKFGEPVSSSERDIASEVLTDNLEARQKGDFTKQCSTLNSATQIEISESSNAVTGASECPSKLEALAKPLNSTAEARKDNYDGSIDELRVKGAKAYALYHGNDGKNYAIPLQRESTGWKVASIVTTEIE